MINMNIGIYKRTKPVWNKGKKGVQKTSEETKKKLSILRKEYLKKYPDAVKTRLGATVSEETKKKMSESSKGKHPSIETKLKISNTLKGKYVGVKSSQWKGGITPISHQIRRSEKYKEWRLNVFIRDNFTCCNCGQIGRDLQAHHIKSFAKHPELRTDINNGVTLCKECHKLTDNYLNKANQK